MEAQYKTRDGRLVLKVSAETQKGLFKALSEAQEVFEAEEQRGVCGSDAIHFRVREVNWNEFYELVCQCGARFQYGQHKKGESLFPKRGEWKGGWAVMSSRVNSGEGQ